jgi:hypothetical protein
MPVDHDYTSPDFARFPSEFLDVPDFSVMAEEGGFECGMIPDPDELEQLILARPFRERMALIPEDEWPERIADIDNSPHGWLERLIRKIKAQLREGSCVYNAAGQGLELASIKTMGADYWVELSAISGYRWNAAGPRTGSNVGQSLNHIREVGLLPVNSERNKELLQQGKFQHTHPATGYYNKFQPGWQTTAKMFRVREWLKLGSVEEWVSAQLQGLPCIGGRDRHCICHVRPLMKSGRPNSLYVNSWGVQWGLTYRIATGESRGFGVDSLSKIATMVGRGAYAIRDVYLLPWHPLYLAV